MEIRKIEKVIQELKAGTVRIPDLKIGNESFSLVAFSKSHLGDSRIIECCMSWRDSHQSAFLEEFVLSLEGTQRWFESRVVGDPQRVLFGVFDSNDVFVAHIGYATFEVQTNSCEIDNVMRGDIAAPKGLMTEVTAHLVKQAYQLFDCSAVRLRVFGDNTRALRLYEAVGFRQIDAIPLSLELKQDGLRWHEQGQFDASTTSRIFVKMEHKLS